MKLYKIINEEKTEVNIDTLLFESVNTHSGDDQTIELSLEKTGEKIIRDLMLQLFIIDNSETYTLKQNEKDDNSVFYYRTSTNKILKFYLYLKKEEEYILVKPSSEGIFYLENNWELEKPIEFKLQLICDEKFSNKFGENKNILFGINLLGDDEIEQKTFK